MSTPIAFLRFIAKTTLNVFSAGLAGEFVVEVIPDALKDSWSWWTKGRNDKKRRDEIQKVADLSRDEVRRQAEQIVAEEAPTLNPEAKIAFVSYLASVPDVVRRTQRRSTDPAGRTLQPNVRLDRPEDVLVFIPTRLPRFKSGDRPPGIGDWQLEELLGVGGFGEVWKAVNPNVPAAGAVALKFCLDSTVSKALDNEAAVLDRVMRQGKHPGIVELRHTYLATNPPCLEYEYVEGGDLAGLILDWHADTALTAADRSLLALAYLHQLTGILAFAHRLSPPIVHRDLKPANILVQKLPDGSVRLRVADFGIGRIAAKQALDAATKLASPLATLPTMLQGACTPLYASPQQQRGDEADPRDDVYSLGVVGWQMLVGDLTKAPGTDWQDALEERSVGEAAVKLFRRCLASEPSRRLNDAGALLQELTAVLLSLRQQTKELPVGFPPELAATLLPLQRSVASPTAKSEDPIAKMYADAARLRELKQELKAIMQLSGLLGKEKEVAEIVRLAPDDSDAQLFLTRLREEEQNRESEEKWAENSVIWGFFLRLALFIILGFGVCVLVRAMNERFVGSLLFDIELAHTFGLMSPEDEHASKAEFSMRDDVVAARVQQVRKRTEHEQDRTASKPRILRVKTLRWSDEFGNYTYNNYTNSLKLTAAINGKSVNRETTDIKSVKGKTIESPIAVSLGECKAGDATEMTFDILAVGLMSNASQGKISWQGPLFDLAGKTISVTKNYTATFDIDPIVAVPDDKDMPEYKPRGALSSMAKWSALLLFPMMLLAFTLACGTRTYPYPSPEVVLDKFEPFWPRLVGLAAVWGVAAGLLNGWFMGGTLAGVVVCLMVGMLALPPLWRELPRNTSAPVADTGGITLLIVAVVQAVVLAVYCYNMGFDFCFTTLASAGVSLASGALAGVLGAVSARP